MPLTGDDHIPMLCLVYISWVSGLVALIAHFDMVGMVLLGLALMCLVCVFFSLSGGRFMFSRKTSSVSPAQPDEDQVKVGTAGKGLTVIGAGTVVEGNILRGENADIYGSFTGDIKLPDGTVSIQPGGSVVGNICADTILVGGEAEGCCEGKRVTVLAQGKLRGICRSVTFSITPGGVFIGTSEFPGGGGAVPVSDTNADVLPVSREDEAVPGRDSRQEEEDEEVRNAACLLSG